MGEEDGVAEGEESVGVSVGCTKWGQDYLALPISPPLEKLSLQHGE